MRARFSFDHGAMVSPELEAQLAPLLDKALERYPDDSPHSAGEVQAFVSYEGDLARIVPLLGPTTRIQVEGLGQPHPLLDLQDQLRAMEARWGARIAGPPESYVNNRVDVHVPGNALLAIDEVFVAEDLCTDALGTYLEEGWRIVAVCPQPDQRRPDYVLGRRHQDD